MERTYLCIDLKSFYASVEAVERGLDPFIDNLVVSDLGRGKGGICLAITPAMKKHGIKNRCRIFEIPKHIEYTVAKPRMKLYMKYSADIYGIYLKYIAKEDIYVYSIDECFFDVTSYLKLYNKTPKEMAQFLIDAVYKETKICAMAGIGTNLFLAKVALDITAKHSKDNIGMLDIPKFQRTLWHHRPITDIWNIGKGIAKRLEKYGIYDLYGVAHTNEEILYKEFGTNAKYIIEHAKGEESCTIFDIKNYIPQNNSVSNSQILEENYSYNDAFLILKEMVETLVFEIVEKKLLTNSISLYIGYSDNKDKSVGGTVQIEKFTDSLRTITEFFSDYYKKIFKANKEIRKINISLNNLTKDVGITFDMFYNKKEHELTKTLINIKNKFGKNTVFKAINLDAKSTLRFRNKMVGGHHG